MPEDQTQFIGKPGETDSKIASISIRGWISLLLTLTVCAMNLIPQIMAATVPVEIKEPLYSGWLLSLGFYFGQNKKT